jgi:hypothetical protein
VHDITYSVRYNHDRTELLITPDGRRERQKKDASMQSVQNGVIQRTVRIPIANTTNERSTTYSAGRPVALSENDRMTYNLGESTYHLDSGPGSFTFNGSSGVSYFAIISNDNPPHRATLPFFRITPQ